MKIRLRSQYVFEGLEDRYETLQKILKHNFGIAESNDELVKNNKASNRDFFILAIAYAITLMIMIYLFIL